jgi:hypothetical protein
VAGVNHELRGPRLELIQECKQLPLKVVSAEEAETPEMVGAPRGSIAVPSVRGDVPGPTEGGGDEGATESQPRGTERLARHADSANSGLPGDREHRLPNSGEHVHVAVRVDVSHTNAQLVQQVELRPALGSHMFGMDPTGEGPCDKPGKRIERAGVWIAQTRDVLALRDRATEGQVEMQAHLEGPGVAEPRHRVRERGAVGQERRRRHSSRRVRFHNAAIHAMREAEIVGIDDQSSFSDSALANRSSESVPGRRALSRRRA